MPNEPRPDLIDDEQLIDALGGALAADDVIPADLVAFASASLSWRTVGQELAELLYDSARDETVAVRDAVPTAARMLSFGEGERGVELELDGDRLLGVIRPEGRYRVEVQRAGVERAKVQQAAEHGPDGALAAETDITGMFELRLGALGAARLVVSALDPGPAGVALVTAWFDLG